MLPKEIYITLLFLLPGFGVTAQTRISDDPPEVLAVFEAMYQFNLPEAEKRLDGLNAGKFDKNLLDLTRVNLMWWWLISGDEKRDYDTEMDAILNNLIIRLKSKPPEQMNEDEIFTMVHAYAYLTRVDIYKERYLKGIINLNHTLQYLGIILDRPYDYDKYMLAAGLYHYFAAVTVTRYPVFAPFFAFAPKSDRDLGYKLLNECAASHNMLIRNESLYYIMKINYQLEDKFTSAGSIADDLMHKYPSNLIYHFHKLMILLDSDQVDQAKVQYRKLVDIAVGSPFINTEQRNHMIQVALKKLDRKKINPAI